MTYFEYYLIIWTKSQDNLEEFNIFLNNLHSTLQFTKERSSTKLTFLFIIVIKSDVTNATYKYYNYTETNQHFNFKWIHITHLKHNIRYCQCRRICSIVEVVYTRGKGLTVLLEFLLKGKYVSLLRENAIQRANLQMWKTRTGHNIHTDKQSVLAKYTYHCQSKLVDSCSI